MLRQTVVSIFLCAALLFSAAAGAEEQKKERGPSYLRVGAGYYDVNDEWDATEFHVEYIAGRNPYEFAPFLGLMGTSDSAAYVYAGLRMDIPLGKRFYFTPAFAPGLYHDGDGKDLGHTVEFRSAVELSYRLKNQARVGVSVYHLSNASLSDSNEGTEVVTLHYSVPLGKKK